MEKYVKFGVSSMVPYGVIRLFKLNFLLHAIERFSEIEKNFIIESEFFKFLLHILVEVPKPRRGPPLWWYISIGYTLTPRCGLYNTA